MQRHHKCLNGIARRQHRTLLNISGTVLSWYLHLWKRWCIHKHRSLIIFTIELFPKLCENICCQRKSLQLFDILWLPLLTFEIAFWILYSFSKVDVSNCQLECTCQCGLCYMMACTRQFELCFKLVHIHFD